ncbi:PAS domain S-box protein, partial [Candidatus Sumerlaeota bacterium]|nr:PAS domain S-box protein [Candidatus Sumerlaeota bacterium]
PTGAGEQALPKRGSSNLPLPLELENLEQVKKQFDAIVRSMPHGLCFLSGAWQIQWVNRAFNALFSPDSAATVTDLTSGALEKCFPSSEDFKDYARRAIASIRQFGFDRREIQLVKTDGTIFWCEISIVRHDPSSTAPGLLATLTDQTERHRAEIKLKDSERRFRSLVQNSTDMLLVYGSDGNVSYANPTVERILGFTPDEMIGRSGYSFVHPDDLPVAKKFFRRLMDSPGEKFQTEFRISHKNGSWRDVEGVATNLLHDPTIQGIVANSRDITERKLAESALRDSEAMFESLVESLAQNVFRKDREGRFTFVNTNFCRTVGRSREDILGKTDFDLFPKKLAQKFRDDDLKVMESGAPVELTEENVAPDGSVMYVQVVKTPVRNVEGKVIALQGIFWDVTEKIRAQETLRESEERYRSFVESLPVGVYRTTPARQGFFVAANTAMARIFGYDSVTEFMKVKPLDLYLDPKVQQDFSAQLVRDGKVLDIEFQLRKRDGSVIWVRNSTSATLNSQGKIVYFDGVIEDITRRKEMEAALRASQEKYGILVNNVTDCLYEVDLAGNLTFANKALTEFLGYSNEELMGKNNRSYMDEANAKKVFEAFNTVFRTGESHKGLVYELFSRDGDQKIVEGSISLMRDNAGKPTGFFGVIRDITERRRAQAALEEKTRQLERANQDLVRKNAELDEFTYIASHDLQEPLRKLTAFTDFLKKDIGENLPPRAEKDLGFIVDAATRMQTLVQDLLQLSRAGKAAMKREKILLNECAQHALEAVAMRIETSKAMIKQDDLPEVWGDRTMLTQLYQNLVGNALKFIAPGDTPEITLTCERVDDQIVLGVKDNGIGIKPEYAEQIFAPFKRLHGRDKYEGSGIGLSICRKCVERHGGTIWVESEPGKGAHFRFTLGERAKKR